MGSKRILGLAAALALLASGAQAASDSRLAGRLPGKADTGRTIRLDTDVACSTAHAYALWSTEAGATSFFAPAAHIGPVGGPYNIVFFPADDAAGVRHGTAGAHVLAAEPARFYAFEWVTFAGDTTKGEQAPPYAPEPQRRPDPLPTWVELTFTPTAGGAHVAFRHYGFGEGALWAGSQAWFTRAWGGVLAGMREACAR